MHGKGNVRNAGIFKNDVAKEIYRVIPNWNAWNSRVRKRIFLKGWKRESQREDM